MNLNKDAMETATTIRKKLTIASAVALTTLLFSMLVLFIPSLNPTTDSHDTWFQRTGSFMVIASIWAEFIVVRLDGYFDQYDEKYMLFETMPSSLIQMHRYVSKSAIVLAIYGTFIWGYGDLLIKNT